MKWVQWCDYKRCKGAKGIFQSKGIVYQRFFSGSTKAKAIKKAYLWAKQERKRLGIIFSKDGPRAHPHFSRKTNRLPVGVSIMKDKKYLYATAYASLKTFKQTKRIFSFIKYGKSEAIKRAINQRASWVKQILESKS